MSRSRFDEILNEEIQRLKNPTSIKDAVAILTGRDNRIVAKPVKKYSKQQKAERAAKIAALKAKRDGANNESIDPTDRIEEIDPIPEIGEIAQINTIDPLPVPDGFPEGTIMNNDATLTLPDGRMVRKIQRVEDVQV